MRILNNSYDANEELLTLPREYPVELAKKNNDVVIYNSGFTTYNLDRFYEFLDNLKNGIKDKIRITEYYVDGPPVIKILDYNGNVIKLTIDSTRYGMVNEPYVFYGHYIDEKDEIIGDYLVKSFYLINDNKEKSIIEYIIRKI
jgi:hypothetical protein